MFCFSQIEAWCPVLPWRRDHDPFKPSVNFREVCTSCQKYHYTLNSLPLLIGQKRKMNFRNQRLWLHLATDYTIIMSRTLKNDHVMYDCSAWFLRVILCIAWFLRVILCIAWFLRVISSSSGTLCCFPSAKKQKIVWPGLFEELMDKLNVVHRINRYQVDDGFVLWTLIYRKAIYPVDSDIQPLHTRGQMGCVPLI